MAQPWRLPEVNGDDGAWGDILNQYLNKEHYNNDNGGAGDTASGGHMNITLRAGTATAGTAPLKFTSGTNLSAVEAGAMEYNGTSLLFSPASTRYNIIMNGLGLSGGQTVIGGTAATDVLKIQGTSGNGTLTNTAIQAVVGNNGGTVALTIRNNTNIGVGAGMTAPTANLHIEAGTTAAATAPLKFTSGSLMTAAEAGAVEFLTDKLYFTQTTSTTRKTIATYDDSSGATGDTYYRDSSGNFVRLAIGGTAGQLLTVASGLPSWATLQDTSRAPRVTTITTSTTPTPNSDTTDIYTITAQAGTATFGAPTMAVATEGRKLMIRIKDSGAIRTLNWNAIYRAGTDIALPVATVASTTMYLGFIYNNTDSKWDLVALTGNI